MIERAKTALWFARRPSHWAQAVELGVRKLRPDHDGDDSVASATEWARARAVGVSDALAAIGLPGEIKTFPEALRQEGEIRAKSSAMTMGGAGDLDLLHAAVAVSGAQKIIETGVAYGWSSLAILSALDGRKGASLVSVDMPYPKMGNEDFVGIVVPERLRSPWTLVREPDRNGLRKAIAMQGGAIDLAHYDSDKSWWGRKYAFPLIWTALRSGGVFISDDIQDNLGFATFVEDIGCTYSVTESDGKYIGIARKA